MKAFHFFIATVVLLAMIFSCQRENNQIASNPSIFLVKETTEGFTSLEALKHINSTGHQAILWNEFVKQAEEDLKIPYLDPTVDFQGRDPVQLKHANVSYDMARGVCERLARSSLLFVLTQEQKYKDLVITNLNHPII